MIPLSTTMFEAVASSQVSFYKDETAAGFCFLTYRMADYFNQEPRTQSEQLQCNLVAAISQTCL